MTLKANSVQYALYLLFTVLVITGLTPQRSFAHDFWIEPDNFTPAPDDFVSVRLREGMDFKGNTLPYIEEWFRDFSIVSDVGRAPVISITGDDPAAQLYVKSGQALLGYMSEATFVELDAARFNQYLLNEGIEFVRDARRARGEDENPAPEYFVRCAKVLLQSTEPGEAVYDEELGYTLELIPLSNPYEQAVGDTLEFRLLYRGQAIEGLQVQALTRERPELLQKIRTDAQGRAVIQLTRPGTWMVKAVQIEPLMDDSRDPPAHWQSYWASYLFTLD